MRLKEKYGYLFIAASAVLFGLMPLMVKKLYDCGLSAFSVTALKNWMALVPLFLLNIREKRSFPEMGQLPAIAAAGLLSNVVTSILLLSSYIFISSGMATTIHFVYPAIVLVGCALIYRQRLDTLQLLCVVLGIGGIALFYFPDISGDVEIKGILLAFCSGISYAAYIIISGGNRLRSMSAVSVAFCMTLISSLLFALWAAFSGDLQLPSGAEVWVCLAMFSLINGVLTLLLFQKGVQLIGPQKAAILSTLEPLTSIVVGILAFGEALTPWSVMGCGNILASVIIISCTGKSKQG